VNAATVLHTGFATVDALVVTLPSNPSQVGIRFLGNGGIDILDGSVNLEELEISGGIVFQNENNAAFPDIDSTLTLASGATGTLWTYTSLLDRDGVLPGTAFNVTRFIKPRDAPGLLTLNPGQYKVSGTVYFQLTAPASTNSVLITQAGVTLHNGTMSNGTSLASTQCIASFNVFLGDTWGGSCSFAQVFTVSVNQTGTLSAWASWPFTSIPISNLVMIGSSSTLLVEELFVRTSENLYPGF